MSKLARTWSGFALLILVVSLGLLLWFNRYNVTDWLVLRNYTAPGEIVAIAEQAGLNQYGKRLFYVKNPQISDRETFATQCQGREQTIVLGCYNGVGIYLFNVSNDRLDGVKQVTAAHEMLHVAYERLSSRERQRVDALIDTAYHRINDPRINALAASYHESEPGSVPNELHSILGTEVRNLGPDLEQYYGQYFADRSMVVSLSERYQKVFNDLKNEVERYDADLALRKSQIDRLEASLDQQGKDIAVQRKLMDQLLASNQVSQYNSEVPSFNAQVDMYNRGIATLKEEIAQYNALVEKRNNLGLEQQSLAKSLDSRLDAISQ